MYAALPSWNRSISPGNLHSPAQATIFSPSIRRASEAGSNRERKDDVRAVRVDWDNYCVTRERARRMVVSPIPCSGQMGCPTDSGAVYAVGLVDRLTALTGNHFGEHAPLVTGIASSVDGARVAVCPDRMRSCSWRLRGGVSCGSAELQRRSCARRLSTLGPPTPARGKRGGPRDRLTVSKEKVRPRRSGG